jgi:nitrile hydratase
MAMVRVMGANGGLNIDAQRFARESLPPDVYLSSSYYRKWFLAIEKQIVERGYVGADEIAAGRSLRDTKPLPRGKFTLDDVKRIEIRGSFGREPAKPAAFAIGDCVRARNINPVTHTRLPRYVRGHVGVIERNNGCHVYPDTNAQGQGDNPQWVYTVVFDARELWGAEADKTLKVSIEAFEPYLEKA